MFETVEKKIKKITQLVLEKSIKENKNPRLIALEIARAKVEAQMELKMPNKQGLKLLSKSLTNVTLKLYP